MRDRIIGAALCWAVLLPFAPASAGDGELCQSAIRAVEGRSRVPGDLLWRIGVVETGRYDPQAGRALPWPWAINVAGEGRLFATKGEAIAATRDAFAQGRRSVDVGCMQINLMHHPDAFASLEQAFDPLANVSYASRFLTRLFAQVGGWPAAAAAYHSSTPGLAEAYRDKVFGVASGPEKPATQVSSAVAANRLPGLQARLAALTVDRRRWAAMGFVSRLRVAPGSVRLVLNGPGR